MELKEQIKSIIKEVIAENSNNTGYPVIDKLITISQPIVAEIILKERKRADDELKRFTKYDEEMISLSLRFDLIKALSKYIEKTDTLISAKLSNSSKGSFVIESIISRDGKEYGFTTDVIYAGGYNIQRLHYRYLVKTKLPKVNASTATNNITEKIKKLNKEERINRDINYYQDLIIKTKKKIAEAEKMSDEEILNQNEYYNRSGNNTWQDMIDRGADKNFGYDENKFNASQKEYRTNIINQFKHSRIVVDKNRVKEFEENIKKLENKLNSL